MLTICTIVSRNYISFARVLVNSFLKQHPYGKAYVLLVDKKGDYINQDEEKFDIIWMEDLPIKDKYQFVFKYDVVELNTAVKPFFIEYLFKNTDIDKLIYFDPDIYIFKPIYEIYNLLSEHNMVLIPHIIKPMEDLNTWPNEIDFLRVGSYNLGFLALRRCEEIFNILDWWKNRMYDFCVSDPGKWLFVDQKWFDIVPSFLDKTYILRDCRYNVAYWNLNERSIVKENGDFFVNGEDLIFYHFSGFDFSLNKVTKYTNNELKDQDLISLMSFYKSELVDNDYFITKQWKNEFDYFDNGIKVLLFMRKLFYDLPEKRKKLFKNPFNTEINGSFLDYLANNISSYVEVSNLLYYIYKMRPDLHKAFPDLENSYYSQVNLKEWAKTAIPREYGLEYSDKTKGIFGD